jgi:two-component system copper resistance phosphate regulon response regulator CusR
MSTLLAQSGGLQASDRGTILLASSNPYTPRGVADVLRSAGYMVDIASDTDWNEISLATLQAVILISPNWNWISRACSAIRRRAPQLAIVVLGPDNITIRIKSFDIGADAYLAEPFAPAELLARIASLIRTRQRISC